MNVSLGHTVTQQILANHSAQSLAELQSPQIDAVRLMVWLI